MIALSTTIIFFTNRNNQEIPEEEIDIDQLELEFNEGFNNQENEYVKIIYDVQEEKAGKYKIKAKIPYIDTTSENGNNINKEINQIFVNKLLQIYNESETYTTLTIDYATETSNNILSLAIKCVLKEKNKAQRTIIKTYNYNIENDKVVGIMELIPEEKSEETQTQIQDKIKKEIKREEAISLQGYNAYNRELESEIYILENATEFYLKNNILYIIYCYGNSNYTSEIDLIITKI